VRTFHHGKTDGFILLRTLLISISLVLLLSIGLTAFLSVFRQSTKLRVKAEEIIAGRNEQAIKELNERR
jgi:hypothetical protein